MSLFAQALLNKTKSDTTLSASQSLPLGIADLDISHDANNSTSDEASNSTSGAQDTCPVSFNVFFYEGILHKINSEHLALLRLSHPRLNRLDEWTPEILLEIAMLAAGVSGVDARWRALALLDAYMDEVKNHPWRVDACLDYFTRSSILTFHKWVFNETFPFAPPIVRRGLCLRNGNPDAEFHFVARAIQNAEATAVAAMTRKPTEGMDEDLLVGAFLLSLNLHGIRAKTNSKFPCWLFLEWPFASSNPDNGPSVLDKNAVSKPHSPSTKLLSFKKQAFLNVLPSSAFACGFAITAMGLALGGLAGGLLRGF